MTIGNSNFISARGAGVTIQEATLVSYRHQGFHPDVPLAYVNKDPVWVLGKLADRCYIVECWGEKLPMREFSARLEEAEKKCYASAFLRAMGGNIEEEFLTTRSIQHGLVLRNVDLAEGMTGVTIGRVLNMGVVKQNCIYNGLTDKQKRDIVLKIFKSDSKRERFFRIDSCATDSLYETLCSSLGVLDFYREQRRKHYPKFNPQR